MKNLAIILTFTILFVSCSKKDDEPQIPIDQLPLITTTGANTAGCIINGLVIIPKNTINSTSGFPVYGLRSGSGINFQLPIIGDDYWYINIANLQAKGKHYWIYLHINDLTNGVGKYNIGQSNSEFYADGPNNPQIIVRETFDGISGKTFISGQNSGIIDVKKFDNLSSIISGTFNCTLYNKDNSSEIIPITEGRFDMKFN
jgi:hypothetical protein